MARVLIIEDDVTLRVAWTRHLEHAGHDVRQATQGDEGFRAFERRPADVVIVDIFMPVQGGLQTIDRLRQTWPEVKIVATSGVSTAGTLDIGAHAVAMGADRFVAKPLEPAELVTLIPALLRERRNPSA